MSWKNWPYWLKGGIIGVGVVLISSFIIGGITGIAPDNIIINLFYIFLIPGIIILAVMRFKTYGYEMPDMTFFEYVLMAVISIIPYFIIGAIIGWVYGRFKKK